MKKSVSTTDAWEIGALGRDAQHVQRAASSVEANVDDALGLQLISIRLQKRLIDDLKFIAKANGVGYQPLVRDVLDKFVVDEIAKIVRDAKARRKIEGGAASDLSDKQSRKAA
jgi:hypothetical protein